MPAAKEELLGQQPAARCLLLYEDARRPIRVQRRVRARRAVNEKGHLCEHIQELLVALRSDECLLAAQRERVCRRVAAQLDVSQQIQRALERVYGSDGTHWGYTRRHAHASGPFH